MNTFSKTTRINVSASELERWHYHPDAFLRLCPPWEKMKVIEAAPGIEDGTRSIIATKVGPLWLNWVAEHLDCRPGESFSDIQISGPFAYWKHEHRFKPVDTDVCELEDFITYRLPFGFLGNVFGRGFIQKKLTKTFNYRHQVTKESLES